MHQELTQAHLKSILHYNPSTGVFTWKCSIGRVTFGKVAGRLHHDGYIVIGIDGKGYSAHRLAFLYMNGRMPSHHVDHINGTRNDNRWENLRAVAVGENHRNAKRQVRNKSGVTGVSWQKNMSKWQAYICLSKKQIHLGFFLEKDSAIEARKSAEIRYGFHPNHGREV